MSVTYIIDNCTFSELEFLKSENNLIIKKEDEIVKTINNFFTETDTVMIQAKDDEGNDKLFNFTNDIKIKIDVLPDSDNVYGTKYNDKIDLTNANSNNTVIAGKGNDIITSNNKANIFKFSKNDGKDIIKKADENDIVYFVNEDDYNSNVSFDDLIFSTNENDLVIDYKTGSVTVENVVGADNILNAPSVQVGLTVIDKKKWFVNKNFTSKDFKKGKLILNQNSDDYKITASDYVSKNNKGVTIKTLEGNNYIKGSNYNDEIAAKGGNNEITEINGKNKIKSGKGNDVIFLEGNSSNVVLTGDGENEIFVESNGINKITCGKDKDRIFIKSGQNIIKAKEGLNEITVNGGINTLSSGSQTDTYNISGGNNVIKSGNGDDKFIIAPPTPEDRRGYGSLNTVTAGKGNRTFEIEYGINTIKTGKSTTKDNYTINGGINNINSCKATADFTVTNGINQIKSGKTADRFTISGGKTTIVDCGGDDFYDMTSIENYDETYISINDTKGNNKIYFNEDIEKQTIYFSVNLGKKAKLIKGSQTDYKYTTGKTVKFTAFDENGICNSGIEISLNKSKEINEIRIGTIDNYDSHKINLSNVAQEVANWLASTNSYKSTDAVFESKDSNAIKELINIYQSHNVSEYYA